MADCHCVIRHPVTAEQREEVVEALGYARRVGDLTGILLALAQLAGPCPARDDQEKAAGQ